MPNCNMPHPTTTSLRHLACVLGAACLIVAAAQLAFPAAAVAAPDLADESAPDGPSNDGTKPTSADEEPARIESGPEAPTEDGSTDDADAADGPGDDGADDPHGPWLDPDQCPTLFGDADDRDYNRRVREAKLTWLEARGNVVEITHTTSWKRPFYLELAGIELVDTEVGEDGEWSAVVAVDDAVPDCPSGRYAVDADTSLGKQARIVGVVDGTMLVDFEGRLAYLMTEDAEIPTWQMVWRSGWYFIKRREVTATKSNSRARTSRNRNRNRRSRRSRRR